MTLIKVPFIFPKYFFCSQQSTSIKVSDLSLVILSAFRLNVVELKPKLYQQPTSRKGNILEPTRAKARENAHDQGAIFFSFASDWLIKWCEFPVLILEWSSVKPKQSRITLDTKMEITLSNDFWLVSVFYYGTQLETPRLWTVFVLIWRDNRIWNVNLEESHRVFLWFRERRKIHLWPIDKHWPVSPLFTISRYILHTYSSHLLRCWQGEFVSQSRASVVGGHFLYFLKRTLTL